MQPITHERSKRRRSRSKVHRKQIRRFLHLLLMVWSLATLAFFLQMLENIEATPVWQIYTLAAATLFGLVLCGYLFFFAKK
jgi:hypothetical protein